jgi:hypothetical protein
MNDSIRKTVANAAPWEKMTLIQLQELGQRVYKELLVDKETSLEELNLFILAWHLGRSETLNNWRAMT